MGFEPTRAEHIGLAVQRLNHSATSSMLQYGVLALLGMDFSYTEKISQRRPKRNKNPLSFSPAARR